MTQRPDCPAAESLLAALRGEGPESTRLRVLDHALCCPACRPELALLRAVSGPEAPAAAAAEPWRRFVPLALAATVVIAVGLFGLDRWRHRTEPTRSGDSPQPVLVAPVDASSLSADAGLFVWHPVTGALRYTLELNAVDGSVLFAASTADTLLAARLDTLARGEHRWMVRVHLDDGSELRSELRRLRLR